MYTKEPTDLLLSLIDKLPVMIRTTDIPVVKNLCRKLKEKTADGLHLDMSEFVQDCGTSRCIAGWIVYLAGEKAYNRLKDKVDYIRIADLIFAASCPWADKTPDYFNNQVRAMVEIEEMAEREKDMLA